MSIGWSSSISPAGLDHVASGELVGAAGLHLSVDCNLAGGDEFAGVPAGFGKVGELEELAELNRQAYGYFFHDSIVSRARPEAGQGYAAVGVLRVRRHTRARAATRRASRAQGEPVAARKAADHTAQPIVV